MVSDGPSRAPAAASSFTSPAPVLPKTWPGSMNASPSRHPRIEAPSPMRPSPAAAMPMPAAVIEAVSRFGIRRVRRSMNAAAPIPRATMASTSASELSFGNDFPEGCLDDVAQHFHGAERRDDYQRDQQGVLEQVLPRVGSAASYDGDSAQQMEWHVSAPRGLVRSPACGRLCARPCGKREAGSHGIPPHDHLCVGDYGAAGVTRSVEICSKIAVAFSPVVVMAPTATSAMRATSNAYSSRS